MKDFDLVFISRLSTSRLQDFRLQDFMTDLFHYFNNQFCEPIVFIFGDFVQNIISF